MSHIFQKSGVAFWAIVALASFGCSNPTSPYVGDAEDYKPPADHSERPSACPNTDRVFDRGASPYRWGDEKVKIEVDVFADLRCPYCIYFAQNVQDLWAERADYRKYVRFYFHHCPWEELHPGTTEIHVAAAAAAAQSYRRFWALHDEIVDQGAAGRELSIGEVKDFLADLSDFDLKRFEKDMDGDQIKDFVQWDKQQGLDAGVEGTPSLFVCGEHLESDTTPFITLLEDRVDELLGK